MTYKTLVIRKILSLLFCILWIFGPFYKDVSYASETLAKQNFQLAILIIGSHWIKKTKGLYIYFFFNIKFWYSSFKYTLTKRYSFFWKCDTCMIKDCWNNVVNIYYSIINELKANKIFRIRLYSWVNLTLCRGKVRNGKPLVDELL